MQSEVRNNRVRRWLKAIDNAREGNLIWLIAVIAVLVRILFYLTAFEALKDDYGWMRDDNYDEIAMNVISGHGYVIHSGEDPNLLRTPLYPILLMLHFMIFGQTRIYLVLVQSILQAAACVLLFKFSRQYTGSSKISFFSAMALAVYPQSLLYTSQVSTESLYLPLIVFTVALLVRLTTDRPGGSYLVLGSFLALLTLCKPTSQLLIVPVILVILYSLRGRKGLALRRISKVVIAFIVVLSPWTIRNYIVTGDLIPVSTRGGRFLYSKTVASPSEEETLAKELDQRSIKGVGEVEARWLDLAVKNIMKNPGHFIQNILRTSVDFWYRGHSRSISIFNALVNFPLLFLGIFGLLKARKEGIFILPIVAVVIYFNVVYGLLHAIARYALPVMPFVMIFATIAIFKLGGHTGLFFEEEPGSDGIDE